MSCAVSQMTERYPSVHPSCSTCKSYPRAEGRQRPGRRRILPVKRVGRFRHPFLQMLMHLFACIHSPLFLVFLREIFFFLQWGFLPVWETRLEMVLRVHHEMHFYYCPCLQPVPSFSAFKSHSHFQLSWLNNQNKALPRLRASAVLSVLQARPFEGLHYPFQSQSSITRDSV